MDSELIEAERMDVPQLIARASYWRGWCIDHEIDDKALVRLRYLLDALLLHLYEFEKFYAEHAYVTSCARCGVNRVVTHTPDNADMDVCGDCGVIIGRGESEPQTEPTDAPIEEALAWVGHAWDDGNASGLDGWVGPGRGAGEVDREAQHARTRLIHKAEAALRAAAETANRENGSES